MALLAGLALVNLITVLRFWQDKRRARMGTRRIPEAQLLMLALAGGSPAAFAARHLLHHKSRKQPFTARLWLIALLQLGGLVAWRTL